MSQKYNFKNIRSVPPGKEIIDIVLSKTQRQTPTVIHAGYSIQRIRAFYMRKVKYTNETISERIDRILEDFPRLDDIHPFYSDLCNVLYDRDHYKLALGQLNVAKHLIHNVSRDYVRMLKYADSLYRAKQLKRAALGRMCTILKKQAASLSYLEEIRKHLGRLPSIDPNSRTLLITGFPNVGKSSFMNQVTHADVEVQPYAFTTKSLFVGHMDYKYLRWQVIDSPGVLDKPLEERNAIEMQAITALAHLQCCVLYFFDVSEQCGWSLEQQTHLFESLRPLFASKPLVVVANKVDVVPLESLPQRAALERLASEAGAPLLPMSAMNAVGIAAVKRAACEALLAKRVEIKARSSAKTQAVLSRLTVAKPVERDAKERSASIPASVLTRRAERERAEQEAKQAFREERGDEFEDELDLEEAEARAAGEAVERVRVAARSRTAREEMWEQGGPGVYSVDLRTHLRLHDPSWQGDVIPEIVDGKNIADFVDPDIEARLAELEQEVRLVLLPRYFKSDHAQEDSRVEEEEEWDSDLDEEEKDAVRQIRAAKATKRRASQALRKRNSTWQLPKAALLKHRTPTQVRQELDEIGYDVDKLPVLGRKRARSSEAMELEPVKRGRRGRDSRDDEEDPRRGTRKGEVYPSEEVKTKVEKLKRRQQKHLIGTGGEADRKPAPKLLKHMIVGKRGIGKTDRR